MKSRYPKLKFDKLQMYFGEPYVVDCEGASGSITVYQPTIGDIIQIGEKKFYQTLNIYITNTTSYRLPLWEMGIDWNEMKDFELFCLLYKDTDPDVCRLLFGDFDITQLSPYEKQLADSEEKAIILYNEDLDIEINEEVYQYIHQYLQAVFNMYPDEKLTSNSIMKQWFIDKDRRQLEIEEYKKKKGEDSSFSILPLISSCVNHPGFKYKVNELKEVGVCEFYDSVKRLQIYESTTALMKGMYSGFVDGKKIKSDDYNFMKEI